MRTQNKLSITDNRAEFSFSSIKDFDTHIVQQIKGYDVLDEIVKGIAESSIASGTNVYDIGCSTGRLMNELAASLDSEVDTSRMKQVCFIGFEPNQNMVSQFRPANSMVHLHQSQVTPATEFSDASLVMSLFTLQFLPVHHRPAILRNIHSGLLPDGAFIWAEKVYASDSRIEAILNGKHLDFKHQNSSAQDIFNKDQRLRSVMRPLTLAANIKMLEDAGFTRYEVFWRINNLVALVAVKSY